MIPFASTAGQIFENIKRIEVFVVYWAFNGSLVLFFQTKPYLFLISCVSYLLHENFFCFIYNFYYSVEIPKNAVKEKTLFRIMILESGQIPHATERLYQPLSEFLYTTEIFVVLYEKHKKN